MELGSTLLERMNHPGAIIELPNLLLTAERLPMSCYLSTKLDPPIYEIYGV